MKSVLFQLLGGLLCVLVLSSPARAQFKLGRAGDADLSAETLQKLVETLASDEMQGRALHTKANAAADFIASEFGKAGLQPLPNQTSFDQVFPLYQTRSLSVAAELNGAAVPAGQAILISGQPEFSWASGGGAAGQPRPKVLRIGERAQPRAFYDSIFNAKTDLLVLVHPAQEKWFKGLASRYAHNYRYSPTAPAPRSTVLLLTDQLAPSSYRVQGRSQVGTVQVRNIAGMLPGRDPAHTNEEVIFGAHYDHLGYLPPVAGDSIANGADDDASGTAAVVALAHYYKKRHDNARTLIFVAFTAEEVGEYGSAYFAEKLPDPARVAAMFNLEMLGMPSKFGPGTAFITGFDKTSFGPILQRNLQGTAYRFEPDPYPDQQLFARSDNYKLARRGIAAHTISTVQLPTDQYYHSVDDEPSTLDFKNMSAVVNAVALGARSIVAGRDTPTRLAPDPKYK